LHQQRHGAGNLTPAFIEAACGGASPSNDKTRAQERAMTAASHALY
jgi:hypothetical protein